MSKQAGVLYTASPTAVLLAASSTTANMASSLQIDVLDNLLVWMGPEVPCNVDICGIFISGQDRHAVRCALSI